MWVEKKSYVFPSLCLNVLCSFLLTAWWRCLQEPPLGRIQMITGLTACARACVSRCACVCVFYADTACLYIQHTRSHPHVAQEMRLSVFSAPQATPRFDRPWNTQAHLIFSCIVFLFSRPHIAHPRPPDHQIIHLTESHGKCQTFPSLQRPRLSINIGGWPQKVSHDELTWLFSQNYINICTYIWIYKCIQKMLKYISFYVYIHMKLYIYTCTYIYIDLHIFWIYIYIQICTYIYIHVWTLCL